MTVDLDDLSNKELLGLYVHYRRIYYDLWRDVHTDEYIYYVKNQYYKVKEEILNRMGGNKRYD